MAICPEMGQVALRELDGGRSLMWGMSGLKPDSHPGRCVEQAVDT